MVITNQEAWVNYNCKQTNNWIVLHNYLEIISHKDVKYYCNDVESTYPTNIGQTVKHIYFTYITDQLLLTLVRTDTDKILFIRNEVNFVEEEETEGTEGEPADADTSEEKPMEIHLTKE